MAFKSYEDHKRYCREYNQRRGKDWRRNQWLQHKYGISLEQYRRMELSQDGKCAICHQPPSGKGCAAVLNVDHCHRTGRIRALLCNPCNQALGLLQENPERIQSMLDYLEVM